MVPEDTSVRASEPLRTLLDLIDNSEYWQGLMILPCFSLMSKVDNRISLKDVQRRGFALINCVDNDGTEYPVADCQSHMDEPREDDVVWLKMRRNMKLGQGNANSNLCSDVLIEVMTTC
jgi:hypothetical protein